MAFSNEDMTDMIKVLGFCEDNLRESVCVYAARYTNRRVSDYRTCARIERGLRETGQFGVRAVDRVGRPQVRNTVVEEDILNRVADDPNISSCRLALEFAVPKSTVNRITRRQLLHPYHATPVQELLPPDFDRRLRFLPLKDARARDPYFSSKILFTHEAGFARSGVFNSQNFYHYAEENLHVRRISHFQLEFHINVWAGIIGDILLGPYILPHRLNGENYLEFLVNTLPVLMEDVPLNVRAQM